MDKFIGKINGVEYANREEFYAVLSELKPEEIKSISLVEHSTNDKDMPHEEKELSKSEEKTMVNYDTNEAVETLLDLFGSFIKSLKTHNKPALKTCNCNGNDVWGCDKNDCKERAEQPKKKQYSLNELVERFSFKDTTYEFTGGELDELELDKFDGLLSRRSNEFSELDWNGVNYDALTELREKFAEKYSFVSCSSYKIDEEQHKLDDRLAKIERLIEAYKDLDMNTDKAEEEYKNLQREFDILDNKNHYYELLKSYYAEIIGVIDAQY